MAKRYALPIDPPVQSGITRELLEALHWPYRARQDVDKPVAPPPTVKPVTPALQPAQTLADRPKTISKQEQFYAKLLNKRATLQTRGGQTYTGTITQFCGGWFLLEDATVTGVSGNPLPIESHFVWLDRSTIQHVIFG